MTKTKRSKQQKKLIAKRSGVIPDLKAAAEPLSIYAGNSAQVDEAEAAYERAEAWAQSPAGTKYGARRKAVRR
jgi:hypothetical protein